MKNQKGITLVALIITIIVMVILAGVIITAAVADGGIIDRAQEAMKENERADVEEIIIGSYVFKVTATTNTIAELDFKKTGIAMHKNLTANGFRVIGATNVKDESGNNIKDENGKDVMTAPIEGDSINVTVEGNHGTYEGTVEKTGLKEDIKIVEDDKNIPPSDEEEDDSSLEVNTPMTFSEFYSEGNFRLTSEDLNYDSNKIHIGDYINYPVEYTNQLDMTLVSVNQGWRICSVNGNSIEIISDKSPLTISYGLDGDTKYVNGVADNGKEYEYRYFYQGIEQNTYNPYLEDYINMEPYRVELSILKDSKDYAENIRVISLNDISKIEGNEVIHETKLTNELINSQSFATSTIGGEGGGSGCLWGVINGTIYKNFIDCGASFNNIKGIRVIVTLSEDIKLFKNNDGIWQITK